MVGAVASNGEDGPEAAKTGAAAAWAGATDMIAGSAGLFNSTPGDDLFDGGTIGFVLWVATMPILAAIGAAEAGSKARSKADVEAAAERIARTLADRPLADELRRSIVFAAERGAGRRLLVCEAATTPAGCVVPEDAGGDDAVVLWLEVAPLDWYQTGPAYDPLIGFRVRVTARIMDNLSQTELFRREYRYISYPASFFGGLPAGLIDGAATSVSGAIVKDIFVDMAPRKQPDPLWAWQTQGTTWAVDRRHFDWFPGGPDWYR